MNQKDFIYLNEPKFKINNLKSLLIILHFFHLFMKIHILNHYQ